MAFRQMHLNKGGAGMAARTACGRSVQRTPMSTDWEGFKAEPMGNRCIKCQGSKQAELNERRDAQALDQWEPEHTDAWKLADAALIAAKRAKVAA